MNRNGSSFLNLRLLINLIRVKIIIYIISCLGESYMSKWERQSHQEDMNIAERPFLYLIKWIVITGLITVANFYIVPEFWDMFMGEGNVLSVLFGIVIIGFLIALSIGGFKRIIQCISAIKYE